MVNEMFKVNFNEQVKVKLTDYGVSILRGKRSTLNQWIKEKDGKELGEYEPKTDNDGYTSFHIWDLMQSFGPYMGLARKLPFEATMIFTKGERVI